MRARLKYCAFHVFAHYIYYAGTWHKRSEFKVENVFIHYIKYLYIPLPSNNKALTHIRAQYEGFIYYAPLLPTSRRY